MQIYDISQPVFSCCVYPGDPSPQKQTLASISEGDRYHLTAFSMCAHNGTHVDAPSHFLRDGYHVESIPLSHTVGKCFVAQADGEIDAAFAKNMVDKAISVDPECAQRILIKGNATVTLSAAHVFADAGVLLVGNESQSVGPIEAPMAVHQILLSKNIVLLEGIRLGAVEEGEYFLFSAPLCLNGAEGAPCRAILLK
jgi:arylformamidase